MRYWHLTSIFHSRTVIKTFVSFFPALLRTSFLYSRIGKKKNLTKLALRLLGIKIHGKARFWFNRFAWDLYAHFFRGWCHFFPIRFLRTVSFTFSDLFFHLFFVVVIGISVRSGVVVSFFIAILVLSGLQARISDVTLKKPTSGSVHTNKYISLCKKINQR